MKRLISLFLLLLMIVSVMQQPAAVIASETAARETAPEQKQIAPVVQAVQTRYETPPDAEPFLTAVSNAESSEEMANATEEAVPNHGYQVSYEGKNYAIENGVLLCDGETMDENVSWLVLRDEALYWAANTVRGCDIKRLNLESKTETVYYHTYCPIDSFDITGNVLYYLFNGEMVKINILSNEEESLLFDSSFVGFWIDDELNIRRSVPFSDNRTEKDLSVQQDVCDYCATPEEYDIVSDSVNSEDFTEGQLRVIFAKRILSNENIVLAKSHPSRQKDNAYAYNNILDTANGKQASRSNYGNAPGGKVDINVYLLKLIIDLEAQYGKICISEIVGASHTKHSKHYEGIAIDVTTIGTGVSKAKGIEVYNFLISKGYFLMPVHLGTVYEDSSHYHIALDKNATYAPINAADYGIYKIKPDVFESSTVDIQTHAEPDDSSAIIGFFETVADFFSRAWKWITSLGVQTENTVQVLGSKNVNGNQWYLLANNTWIKGSDLEAIAVKQDSCEPIHSIITISPTAYPIGNIKKGAFILKGTIQSTCNISTITAEVIDVATNAPALACLAYVNAMSYSIQGSKIDKALTFKSLTAGHSYYLKYEVTDITGNSKSWQSEPFSVYANAPSVSVAPAITAETVAAGQLLRVSCSDPAATIHYTVNGGPERTGTSPLTENLTASGSYNITAWTTRSGYSSSAENYKAVSVSRAAAPTISEPVYTDQNAYVTLSGVGEIYYTTDGSAPTSQSSRYTGPIRMTSSCTVKALCVEYGKQNSEIAMKFVNLTVPSTPSVEPLSTEAKIAVGKVASVQWNAVTNATAYDALLYLDNVCVGQLENIRGTTASFTLDTAGSYRIAVRAKNFLGVSGESNAQIVEAMAPVTVTVVDHIVREYNVTDATVAEVQARINEHDGENALTVEGNIISVQTVDYGSLAARPNTPTKKGFTFAGYSIGWNTPVTSDITVYAEYEINYYTVEFWNYYGENTGIIGQIGSTQEVMYTDSAVPPTDYAIPTGYILAGWSVDNSVSSCFDYTYVEGSMRLYTSYAWENENLPSVVEISRAARNDNYASYSVDLTYTNYRDLQARLIVSLYTGDGRMVYTQTKDIDVKETDIGKTISDSMTLNYNMKVSKVSALLVNAENDVTGGAISAAAVTTNISFPFNSGYWGAWTDWSPTAVSASDTKQVETKTQYMYRDKQYTTATSSTLADWTRYNMTAAVGAWSSWSTTPVTAFSNDAQLREVNTRYIEPTYKTQYHYYRYWGTNTCPWTFKNSAHPNFDEIWIDYEMPYRASTSVGNLYKYYDNVNYGNAGNTGYAGYKYWLKCAQTSDGNYMDWTRQVQTGGGYWEYQYRDTFYTYYFWKWGNWSGWTDVAYSASDSREVQMRTVYRYRDWVAEYDPSQDHSPEETTEASYDFSGCITGVAEDYEGRKASVLVYKKTNTDPTQEQLEYVDQITLGENNSYMFTVNPKEMIDYQLTGDYIVTLSIEGSERLVNIDVIQAPRPSYTVTFFTEDGVEFASQVVAAGEGVDVNEIGIPTLEGHRFVKWNKSVVNINRNLDVTAVFEKETYPIVFVDHENETVELVELPYGAPITAQIPDEVEGLCFEGWDGIDLETGAVVTGPQILTAIWHRNVYSVTFVDFDGEPVGDIQYVAYGEAAEPPAPIIIDDVVYPWSTDGEAWWNVKNDMAVYPAIVQARTLSAPTSTVQTDDMYGFFIAELETDNEDTTIYYILNDYLTEYDAIEFVNELTMQAEAKNMTTETDREIGNEYDDESYSIIDDIQEYTEPLELCGTSAIYTFAVDAEGNISNVAVYSYGDELDEDYDDGILPNVYEDDSSIITGDVNGDGEIDSNDLTALARHLAMIELIEDVNLLAAADTNGDGFVDAEDLTLLARYVANIITSFD